MANKTFRYTYRSTTYTWKDYIVIRRDKVWAGDTTIAAKCFWNIDVNKQKAIVYGLGMSILETIKVFPRDFETLKEAIFDCIKESGFLSKGIKSTRKKWDTCKKFYDHTRFNRALRRLQTDCYALADKEKASAGVSNENKYIPPSTPDVPDTDSAAQQNGTAQETNLNTAKKMLIILIAASSLMLLFKKKK